jgi:CRP-like cAMP-binding protein
MVHPKLLAHHAVLAESQVLHGLGERDLDRVLEVSLPLDVAAETTIMYEGEPGPGLYIILKGAVECFLPSKDKESSRPTKIFFRRNTVGDNFGELSLVDRGRASASVRATEPSFLCLIPAEHFRRLAETDEVIGRQLYRNLLEQMVERLRDKDRELDTIEFL